MQDYFGNAIVEQVPLVVTVSELSYIATVNMVVPGLYLIQIQRSLIIQVILLKLKQLLVVTSDLNVILQQNTHTA